MVSRMLDALPSILRSNRNAAASSAQTGSVSQRVLADLKSVHRCLLAERTMSKAFDSSNAEKGKRLLFLFQKDLLPGISGKILESKGNRDNLAAQKVSWEAKALGWFFIGALNVGMLFYILLFALSQTVHRQGAWALSFALWLVVEIIFVSSATVVFTHILLPSLIMKDVSKIKSKLVESIRAFNNGVRNGRDKIALEGPEHFNAAEYLFVSTRLAKEKGWSDLREAQIIALFRTPWPKQSYQRESSVSKSYSKKYSALVRSASIIAIFFLTQLLQVPPGLQDMVVQTVSTVTIGYTVLIHLQLFYIFPILVVLPTIVVGVIVHFWIQSSRANEKLRLAKLFPVSVSPFSTPSHTGIELSDAAISGTVAVAVAEQNLYDVSEDEEEREYCDIDLESRPDSDSPEGGVEVSLHLPLEAAEAPKGHTTRRQSVQHGLHVLETLKRAQQTEEVTAGDGAGAGANDDSDSDDSDATSVHTAENENEDKEGDTNGIETFDDVPASTKGDMFPRENDDCDSSSESDGDHHRAARRPYSAVSRTSGKSAGRYWISSSDEEGVAAEDSGEDSDYIAHNEQYDSHMSPHCGAHGPYQEEKHPQGSEDSSGIQRCRSISLPEQEGSGEEEPWEPHDPHDAPFASSSETSRAASPK